MTPAAAGVRDLGPADLDWVLAINREHEALLSVLDRAGLARLTGLAVLARAAGTDAFLLAMDQDADYESWNFRWFLPRWPRFLYVDRVAVASTATAGGLGRLLYADLFAQASARGYPVVCAEVNSDPPNHASLAFHDRLGFRAVGEAAVPGRGKSVRFFARAP